MDKKKIAFRIVKGVTKTLKKAEKTANKANPLNKKVDKSTITDTGTESVKQINTGIRYGRQTVKTVKSTVKTTKKTIKTIKNAPKNIKRTAKATVKAAKVAAKVLKAAVSVVSKVIAFLVSNPIVLLILLIILLVAYIIYACVLLFTGSAVGEASTKQAFSDAAGLEDVPEQFKKGIELVEKSKEKKKKEFDEWIDRLYYDENNDNLKNSDLVYMKRFDRNDGETEYQKSLASPYEKTVLKNALDWSKGIDDIEIISIAYVLAEKEANEITENTAYQINSVTFSEQLIDKVIDKVLTYYDSRTDDHQRCPGGNCYLRKERNAEWDRANRAQDKLQHARESWNYDVIIYLLEMNNLPGAAQPSYFDNNVRWRIENWENTYGHDSDYGDYYPSTNNRGHDFWYVLDAAYNNWWDYWVSIPEYITTPDSENNHKCYSKGLEFFSKEEIMILLNFNETEKLWEQYTEYYLRSYSENN